MRVSELAGLTVDDLDMDADAAAAWAPNMDTDRGGTVRHTLLRALPD